MEQKRIRSVRKLIVAIGIGFFMGLFAAGCSSSSPTTPAYQQDHAVRPSPTPIFAAHTATADMPDARVSAPKPTAAQEPTLNAESDHQAAQVVNTANDRATPLPDPAVIPKQWGEKVNGVKRRLDTKDKVMALTFDACGGEKGSGYDKKLIDFLIKEQVPATLFINSRWIDANPDVFRQLAANPLFEIENHGTEHKPLSVTGRSAYGIKGTTSLAEARNEVLQNAEKIEKLTGRKPKYFRSGTAYYDEIAIKVVQELGEEAVNFDVLGDAGATYSTDQIVHALDGAHPGSIVISHMNHPEKDTAEGIEAALPRLKQKGYSFVKLEDYALK
jgi:peptidoglycan/xylan/chitin deacetylase (PgdA/CDA1 family)